MASQDFSSLLTNSSLFNKAQKELLKNVLPKISPDQKRKLLSLLNTEKEGKEAIWKKYSSKVIATNQIFWPKIKIAYQKAKKKLSNIHESQNIQKEKKELKNILKNLNQH